MLDVRAARVAMAEALVGQGLEVHDVLPGGQAKLPLAVVGPPDEVRYHQTGGNVSEAYFTVTVAVALKNYADAQAVINAGYNLKVALAGPEVGVEVLEAEMQGKAWGGAGIGFGVRSAQDPDMTLLFIDTIDAMRKLPVEGPIVFNYNAKTFLWALQQRIPPTLCQNP